MVYGRYLEIKVFVVETGEKSKVLIGLDGPREAKAALLIGDNERQGSTLSKRR